MKRKISEVIQKEESDHYLDEMCSKISNTCIPPPYRKVTNIKKIRDMISEYVEQKKSEIDKKHKQEVQTLKKSKRIIFNKHDCMVKSLSNVLEKTIQEDKDIEQYKIFLKRDSVMNRLCNNLPQYIKCNGRCGKLVCKEINNGIKYLKNNFSTENTNKHSSEINIGVLNVTKIILIKHSNRCIDDNCKMPFCVELNNSQFSRECFKYHNEKN